VNRRALAAILLTTSAATVVPGTTRAEDAYPSRPIRFLVPFAAGSATDTVARVIGQTLASRLGWAVVVDDMPGASGFLAAQAAARAAPDGYTVLIASSTTHAANHSLFKQLPYDPVADFAPVSKLGMTSLALVVNLALPANSVAELIAYAKAHPGELTFGSGSSSARVAGEMLQSLAGIELLNVPYKSNLQAVTDLVGGRIDLVFADVTTTLSQAAAGKVRALAVSSAARARLAPDLPTMQELGVAGFDLTAWFAAFLPAGTPAALVARLNMAIGEALADPAAVALLLRAGIEPQASSPNELAEFARAETEKWAVIVQEAGIAPE
jgi:tripartite-type tricarboxylate transporter receptor subunit TctC